MSTVRPLCSLVCYINADGDLLPHWLEHYRALGVDDFRLVVHGPDHENAELLAMLPHYPITIVDRHHGEFGLERKVAAQQDALRGLPNRWVLLVDSDEFVQLPPPAGIVADVVQLLAEQDADCLAAPLLHRVAPDGVLRELEAGRDPDSVYPLGAPDLYVQLGMPLANIHKHPLFFNHEGVEYYNSHRAPKGARVAFGFRGVTHHFKWRASVKQRILRRAHSRHTWAHQQLDLATLLESRGWRLPMAGAFRVSPQALAERGFFNQ